MLPPRFALSMGALTLALASGVAPRAHATLALTAAGQSDGFNLSIFATIDPDLTKQTDIGPLGVAYAGNGRILVSNFHNDTNSGGVVANSLYSFADTNGQTLATALDTQLGSGTFGVGMASAGGHAYGQDPNTQYFAQYNSDGTINHDLTSLHDAGGFPIVANLGMAGNPINGHILATSSSGIIDIDPTANGGAGSFRVVVPLPKGDGDGVVVSPDGQTVYAVDETGGCINGFSIATGVQVANICGFTGHPDGVGVIVGTKFNGDLVVNNNDGSILLYDFLSQTSVAIATGGTRGDYATIDPTDGSLLLDFSDVIARLTIQGGSFVEPPAAPEPAALIMFGAGLAGIVLTTSRSKANARRFA